MKVISLLKGTFFLICAYLFFSSIFFLYEILSPYPTVEIKRWSNPKKSIDTVLAIKETGATDDTPYYIYILPIDKKITENDSSILHVTNIKNIDSIKITWVDDNKFIIIIDDAIVHYFYGYHYSKINNKNISIYIKLVIDKFYKN